MNENEIFVDIEGYEGLYQVSNLGRVKSLNYNHTNQEKIIKFGENKDGYLLVSLCKNGKSKTCKVHRLVANAFLENLNNLPQVNHIDENKTNNIVSNLEWCDAKYNNTYGTCQQRRLMNIDYKTRTANTDWKSIGDKNSKKLINRKDLSKQVYQYDLNDKLIKIWKSTAECGRNGFNFGNIAACCRNCYLRKGNNVYKNFIWSYEEIKKGE